MNGKADSRNGPCPLSGSLQYILFATDLFCLIGDKKLLLRGWRVWKGVLFVKEILLHFIPYSIFAPKIRPEDLYFVIDRDDHVPIIPPGSPSRPAPGPFPGCKSPVLGSSGAQIINTAVHKRTAVVHPDDDAASVG